MSRAAAPVSSRRVRVDELLVQRGDAQDLTTARALVMSGRVHGAGRRYTQAGLQIPGDTELRVKATREYVSRGGEKLVAPLDEWPIPVEDRICLDVGASTGGFTDVLLRRGAERVYAVDAGYGQLAESSASRPARCVARAHPHLRTSDAVRIAQPRNGRCLLHRTATGAALRRRGSSRPAPTWSRWSSRSSRRRRRMSTSAAWSATGSCKAGH